MQNALLQARVQRGWKQSHVVVRLRTAASAAGITLPAPSTLRVTLSGWENGHHQPGELYRDLLCQVFEATEADLRIGAVTPQAAAPPSVGRAMADYLEAVFVQHSSADFHFGSQYLLSVVSAQTEQAQTWAAGARGVLREDLLRIGNRFAEFCGWLHQDQADYMGAETWTRRALDMAQELADTELVAYALMRRSNIATEAGRADDGPHLAEAALRHSRSLAPEMRALALRQKAAAHALRQEGRECTEAVGLGMEAAAATTGSFTLGSYCTVAYMGMEGGQAVAQLGRPEPAVRLLADAAAAWPAGQEQDKGLCLARLANAYAASREPGEACRVAGQAVAVLRAAPSARTSSSLRELRGRLVPYRRRPDVMALRAELATAV
ncbi:hypothetical protein [Kineococcus terrestris]|uniref:hypothetical protein n=1 Tax=Kineococcus terrestris TaxID=2044856 RepID=UPI0034DB20AE